MFQHLEQLEQTLGTVCFYTRTTLVLRISHFVFSYEPFCVCRGHCSRMPSLLFLCKGKSGEGWVRDRHQFRLSITVQNTANTLHFNLLQDKISEVVRDVRDFLAKLFLVRGKGIIEQEEKEEKKHKTNRKTRIE